MKYFRNLGYLFVLILLLTIRSYAEGKKTDLNLMPWPAEIRLTGGNYRLNQDFTVEVTGKAPVRLYRAASRMLRRLSGRTGLFFSQDYLSRDSVVKNPCMIIHADRPGRLRFYDDESYKLEVTPTHILLSANTDIGAMRGIETFLQLLEADSSGYYFPDVNIVDHPRFPWRGLMIDACRHFMPIDVIKRNIRGMAAVKLNVLHWHLSDDQGFRAESRTFPKLTGMGSDGLFYTQREIKEIIKYAADRGIHVVPEFDVPAHSTSWVVGYPQYASAPGPYSVERRFGVFNPVFNSTIGGTYVFLDKFFKEMCGLFPGHYVHIGGDENNGVQWNANPEIQAFMKAHKIPDNRSLQTYFENRIISILAEYHKNAIGWEEILNPHLPKTAIIQSWLDNESVEQAVLQGYRVISSSAYYLDHYMPASSCYLADPVPDSSGLTAAQKKLIIGGEACMWSEFVTPENVDSRIWPRAAAVAERLWSPRDIRNVRDMYRRLDAVSLELEGLGLTQLKNQEMMIRRLTEGYDSAPLTDFIDVVSPAELYTRARSRVYTSYSPLTRVVDAAVPDPKVARDFAYMVDDMVNENSPNPDTLVMIERNLLLWKENSAALKPLINESPILREIEPLSNRLSMIASIGLKALSDLKSNAKGDPSWVSESLSTLDELSAPVAEVQLMIVQPIEELVKRAAER